jgi:hypothetical protein
LEGTAGENLLALTGNENDRASISNADNVGVVLREIDSMKAADPVKQP